jgi:hypothetical protein
MKHIKDMRTLDSLMNGADVKMTRTLKPIEGLQDADIVLCHLPYNDVTPYATWQLFPGEYGGTVWGHYFRADEEAAAIKDFQTRGR